MIIITIVIIMMTIIIMIMLTGCSPVPCKLLFQCSFSECGKVGLFVYDYSIILIYCTLHPPAPIPHNPPTTHPCPVLIDM